MKEKIYLAKVDYEAGSEDFWNGTGGELWKKLSNDSDVALITESDIKEFEKCEDWNEYSQLADHPLLLEEITAENIEEDLPSYCDLRYLYHNSCEDIEYGFFKYPEEEGEEHICSFNFKKIKYFPDFIITVDDASGFDLDKFENWKDDNKNSKIGGFVSEMDNTNVCSYIDDYNNEIFYFNFDEGNENQED